MSFRGEIVRMLMPHFNDTPESRRIIGGLVEDIERMVLDKFFLSAGFSFRYALSKAKETGSEEEVDPKMLVEALVKEFNLPVSPSKPNNNSGNVTPVTNSKVVKH